MKKIIKRCLAILAMIGILMLLGVVGEQDRAYYEAEHQPYQPVGGFIQTRR